MLLKSKWGLWIALMLWRLEWDFREVTLKFDIFIVNINHVVLRNIFRQQLLKANGFFGIARLCGKYILVFVYVYDMITVRASFVI